MICYAIDTFQRKNMKTRQKLNTSPFHCFMTEHSKRYSRKKIKPDSPNFWFSSSSSWQQKHSSAVGMASEPSQIHHRVEPIRELFASTSPPSSSSSPCESLVSSPGGYVGSKRNGYTLMVTIKWTRNRWINAEKIQRFVLPSVAK